MSFIHRRLPLLLLIAASTVTAQTKIAELPGAHDHNLISRYAGSILVNIANENFASVRVELIEQ